MTTTIIGTLAELEAVRDQRHEHEKEAQLLRERTDQLVLQAAAEGHATARIARAAGLSRQTTYSVLAG